MECRTGERGAGGREGSQLRGGAREPHARRTPLGELSRRRGEQSGNPGERERATLSVRPRAPTKQMGPSRPPAGYLPRNVGGRFSTKARIPSRASSVSEQMFW